MMRAPRKWLKLTSLFFLILFLQMGCEQPAPPVVEPAKKEQPTNAVNIKTLKPERLTTQVQVTAKLEPSHQVQVVAKVAGELKKTHFELGDYVEKGKLLAEIDDEIYRAVYRQATSQYTLAKDNVRRLKPLLAEEFISEQEFEVAKNQLIAAKAAYTQARLSLSYTVVESPISGIIAAKLVEVNNQVAPGTPLAILVDNNPLEIKVGVTEYDIPYIQQGSKVTIQAASLPGRTFSGRVIARGTQADPQTNTFPLKIHVPNASGILRGGILAEVSIDKRHYPRAILLAQDVILEREEGKFVYVVNAENKAILQEVELGESRAQQVHVIQGLAAGDRVVVTGQQNLVGGEQVTIVTTNVETK